MLFLSINQFNKSPVECFVFALQTIYYLVQTELVQFCEKYCCF